MKTFKKLMSLCSILFFASCGDSGDFAGTSEDTNEFAERLSSSSEIVDEEISSSNSKTPIVENSSSSSKNNVLSSSGTSKVLTSSSAKSSSSSAAVSSSSSERGNTSSKISSSSKIQSSSSRDIPGSSERGLRDPVESNPMPKNTLDSYLKDFKLDSSSFDGGVLSAKLDRNENLNASDPVNPPHSASATEFDGSWPHKFVKQNIGALDEFFPMAKKEYSEIISAIKNETLDANCGLYMLNVDGNENSAGFVLANVAKDTLTVLDIPVGKCNPTQGITVRFLFYYCGELDSRPEINHVLVENNLSDKCPVYKDEREWVKDKSRTP